MSKELRVWKRSYGQYASSNYGSHTQVVMIGSMNFYFSYDTIVAFENGVALYCSENVWSTTTGKHLNWIQPDKKRRIPHEEFKVKLTEVLKQHNFVIN